MLRAAAVSPDLAGRFQPWDHLLVIQETGKFLLIPAKQKEPAASPMNAEAMWEDGFVPTASRNGNSMGPTHATPLPKH
jgi:hypothetical protein